MTERLTADRWRHLRSYVEMAGSFHDAECPGDDTCDCTAKPMHDAVNALCALPEPVALSAPDAGLVEAVREWQAARKPMPLPAPAMLGKRGDGPNSSPSSGAAPRSGGGDNGPAPGGVGM